MDVTKDGFLGGAVTALQPAKGYRAGVDAVLLAAAVPAKQSERVLELGCGVGVASLCLNARVAGLDITGVEIQSAYADLATQNGLNVITADLRELPASIRNTQYHHVMMNPPYFDRNAGNASDDQGRDTAMGGDTAMADWIAVAAKRLAPKGYLTLIQRIERLPEILGAIGTPLGSIRLRPIVARADKTPHLFLLQARHSGRAPFVMMPPLVMHEGAAHDGDKESYTQPIRDVLRHGAPVSMLD